MQKLEIKALHDERRTCLQDLIATAAGYWHKDCAMMHSRSWSGVFHTASEAHDSAVGHRLDALLSTAYDELDRYHGLRVDTRTAGDSGTAAEIVVNQLHQGLPSIVYLDQYWTPWMKEYQVRRSEHYVLITGMTPDKEAFYCVDPINKQEGAELQLAVFLKGNNGGHALLEPHSRLSDFSREQWVEALRSRLFPPGRPSVFDHMHRFAEAVSELGFDMKREAALGTSEHVWFCPLIWNLLHFEKGRHCFGMAASYVGSHYGLAGCSELAEAMNKFAAEWVAVRNMLVKMVYLNEAPAAYKGKIADKVHQLAALESNAAASFFAAQQAGSVHHV